MFGEQNKGVFTGPKGVGKTACLLAYWQQYINARQKVILLGANTIRSFLQIFTYKVTWNHYMQIF